MAGITTHVLDTAIGKPAAGVRVVLERRADDGTFQLVGSGETDGDGRLRTLTPQGASHIAKGTYRITFDTAAYFSKCEVLGFYPEAAIMFEVRAEGEHYHVPLLVSPFGYSTYRGS